MDAFARTIVTMRSPSANTDSYLPENNGCTVPALESLLTPAGHRLLDAVRDFMFDRRINEEPPIAQIERWRCDFSTEVVHAAMVVARTAKAAVGPRGKFSNTPKDIFFWAVPEALEQATSGVVADYKAQKLLSLLPGTRTILDICCGIGGDAISLARHASVEAWEMNPERAWMARINVRRPGLHPVVVHQQDILQADIPPVPHCAFHMDPARRSGGKRLNVNSSMIPDPWRVMQRLQFAAGGMVKLSPAIDFSTLPSGHLEIISHDNSVVQALLWTHAAGDAIGRNQRTATVITRGGAVWSFSGSPGFPATLHEPADWVYELDGALTRAGLAAPFLARAGLVPLTVDGGYATGIVQAPHAALAAFKVIAVMPYGPQRILRWLKSQPSAGMESAPIVEVKTRGGLGLDTDRLQREWSGAVRQSCTILIYSSRSGRMAIVARRLPTSGQTV